MSKICFCVINGIKDETVRTCCKCVAFLLAEQYGYGVQFSIKWNEPVVAEVKENALLISIQDSKKSDCCEMFLLPDNCICNGHINCNSFNERMTFLQLLSDIYLNMECCVELYLGDSGTLPEEFREIDASTDNLIKILSDTVGTGRNYNVRINVTQ